MGSTKETPEAAQKRLALGIDPGTKTTLATADATGALATLATADATGALATLRTADATGALATLRTADALASLRFLDGLAASGAAVFGVWIEDSRDLPIYARNREASRGERDRIARGVGHTDFLTGFYADVCRAHGWPVRFVVPSRAPKWDRDTLARLTGWTGRTSEHARDAARLVFGRTAPRLTRGVARGAPRGAASGAGQAYTSRTRA